ncbi:MAG: hypothetical protein P0Y64_04255 [Candidatus Sphingomonas colombiensis]|nr:hypothetical protein [Sphingomonas sp.]WEK44051.1 MAG: hypothetical protein P0Y64_04255 [Sphingomonas sp.]
MRKIVTALALSAVPMTAFAQTPPAAPAPAKAPATVLNGDTPIETIIADPAGKAVIDKDMPELQAHPAFAQIKAMSLRQVQPYAGGAITDELIAKVEADLAAAKGAK